MFWCVVHVGCVLVVKMKSTLYKSDMENFSLLSSSLLSDRNNIGNNWLRYFEDIILSEIQSLNRLNFSVNRDSVDPREINVRFEYETRALPIFIINASYESHPHEVTFFDINMSDLFRTPVSNNGLSVVNINESSQKIIIDSDTECYICLDTLLQGSCVRRLNVCTHMYCIDCIDTWLKNHNSCPVCKCTVYSSD